MPRIANKETLTREAFAAAALTIIDEQGFDALSMRSLGTAMGVHATAIYYHFPHKDALVEASLAYMLEREGVGIPDAGAPRERLLGLLRSLRSAFRRHPNLALPNLTSQDEQATAQIVAAAMALLSEMGLKGRDLVVAYQMLETFSVGSNAYDWGEYPDALEARRRGRKLSGQPEFTSAARSLTAMRKINDEAFELTANALLDACERLASR